GGFKDIGWSEDPDFNFSVEINDRGQVAGGSSTKAWVWNPDGTHHVIATPGFETATTWGLNNHGKVVGVAWPGFFNTANGFVYDLNTRTFTVWNYPGAALTSLYGINNRGDIVGEFTPNLTSSGIPFVRWADGSSQVLSLPGLSGARVYDINDDRVLVGRYKDNANKNRSFFAIPLSPLPEPLSFTFETVTAPFLGATETLLSDIDNNGRIIGRFKNGLGVSQGLILDGTNQITFNITGTTATFPGGANSFGQIAGFYHNATNPAVQHGFLQSSNGSLTTIDGTVPGTTNVFTVPGWANTLPGDINNLGEVAGTVINAEFTRHAGFFRDADGRITVFSPPQAVEVEVFGLNDKSEIVGEYVDTGGKRQGFIARPAKRLDHGHTDAGLAFEDGRLQFHIHDEEGNAEYAVNDAVLALGKASEQSIPDEVAYGFLGRPGYSTWILPATNNPELLYLGLAAEEIQTGLFANDQLRIELVSVLGAGEFALYSAHAFGSPVVHLNTADGYDERDALVLQAGGHQHFNWAFSAPGTYSVRLRASGTLADGSRLVSTEASYTFTVPEPELPQPPEPDSEVYLLSPLGTLGGDYGSAVAINEAGTITGHADLQSEDSYYSRPFRLSFPGSMEDLGTLGGDHANGQGIHADGEVVGAAIDGNGLNRPFHFANGSMKDLGTLGGDNGEALGISDGGVIVGWTETVPGESSPAHAFRLVPGGSLEDLATLGGSDSRAFALNSEGTVVGWSRNAANETRAFRWTLSGGMADLGTLGGNRAFATDINDSGDIVGRSRLAGNAITHATLW
ncbi:MAG: choice-of-anchor M domain-containing protein, partial [Limisphaerales bacterium]